MSRVIPPRRRRARDIAGLAMAIALAAAVGGFPAVAEDLPACDGQRAFDCRLPDWSASPERDVPSLFGPVDGIVWVADAAADADPGALDILGVGVGEVDIADPGSIRRSEELLKRGRQKRAVPRGTAQVVRIVLDRPPDQVTGGHSSVHVATDVNGSRSDNAPTGVNDPANPFAGSDAVYSLAWASTTGQTRLLSSDLARGWYTSRKPFAAAWASPTVLDVLLAPGALGPGLRVVTHTEGDDGGYDHVSIGPAPVPADGRLGLVPRCIEASTADGPYLVARLVENGQTLRDVPAPASWRGGMILPLSDEERGALAPFVAGRDDDGDGRMDLDVTVSLFEDGVVIRQGSTLELAVEGDEAQLALAAGLTRRGYEVLRDIELEPQGDAVVDAWLARATDAFSAHLPPFRSTKRTGLVAGEAIGACVPWIEPAEIPLPAGSEPPGSGSPAGDA